MYVNISVSRNASMHRCICISIVNCIIILKEYREPMPVSVFVFLICNEDQEQTNSKEDGIGRREDTNIKSSRLDESKKELRNILKLGWPMVSINTSRANAPLG